MRVAEPKPDKRALFAEVAKASAGVAEKPATTPKKSSKKAAEDADTTASATDSAAGQ
jgi:small subunit ribosomal protein S16